jgi:hypothetical protein
MSEIPGQSCRALPDYQSVEKGHKRSFPGDARQWHIGVSFAMRGAHCHMRSAGERPPTIALRSPS